MEQDKSARNGYRGRAVRGREGGNERGHERREVGNRG